MENLFWLLILGSVGGVAIWYFNGGSSSQSKASSGTRQPTVFTLQLGDVVQYDNTDWIIEDKLTYNDDGWEWVEYLLQDGDRVGFLAVDDDDKLKVSFSEKVKDCPAENPPASQITYNGQTFTRQESGTAQMKRQRKPNSPPESCQYYDYSGPGDAVMSIEVWNSEVEVGVGLAVRPYQLTFLPGDGESVYRSDV